MCETPNILAWLLGELVLEMAKRLSVLKLKAVLEVILPEMFVFKEGGGCERHFGRVNDSSSRLVYVSVCGISSLETSDKLVYKSASAIESEVQLCSSGTLREVLKWSCSDTVVYCDFTGLLC